MGKMPPLNRSSLIVERAQRVSDFQGFFTKDNVAELTHAAGVDETLKALQAEAGGVKQARRVFHEVAEARYARIVATGETIPWQAMRAYLESRMAGKTVKRPVAKKPGR